MKKNLALILALVMLLGTIFSVLPVAAAEASASASYEPKISYANINYSDKMYMMFAIPAPEALGAGDEVKLLVWANKADSSAYSFNDQNKAVLSAEAEKATINGAQYLVYKYAGLTAADMTNILAARPVIVNTTEGVTSVVKYGDVVEYSVLEYVATAKGAFGGTALADNVLATLDSMLVFGGLAQKYSGKNYDYLASDELSEIWYVPVINGVEGEKVFGGFFKKGAEFATVSAPHYDEYAFVSYLDNDGKAIHDIDGDVTNGDQLFAPEEGNFEIKVSYTLHYMGKADANEAKSMALVADRWTSIDHREVGKGNKYASGQGALGCNLSDPPSSKLTYASVDVVDDPYVAGNKVYKIVGNHPHSLGLGNSTDEWKTTMKVTAIPGFGDTVAALATIEFSIARDADGNILRTGNLRVRNKPSGDMFHIGYFEKGGTFMLFTGGTDKDVTPLPTKVAETGWTRYVFTFDLVNDVLYVYASDANGNLMYQGSTSAPYLTGTFAKANNWMEIFGVEDVRVEWTGGGGYNSFSDDELLGGQFNEANPSKLILADLDGDGKGETPIYQLERNEDGTFKTRPATKKVAVMETVPVYEKNEDGTNKVDENGQPIPVLDENGQPITEEVEKKDEAGNTVYEDVPVFDENGDPLYTYVPVLDANGKEVLTKDSKDVDVAARWCFKEYRAMYLKDFCTYVGTPVSQLVPDDFVMYDIDANSAVNATTKNALDYVNNFGDEELVSKIGLPKGSTFGGLGTNFQSVAVANYINYAGLDIVDDPYQAGNKVYSFNGTDAGIIWQAENIKNAGSRPAYTSSLKISTRAPGFFTGSVYPVITYDMTVGGNGTDRMLETDTIRFRGASNTYVHLFKIAADGSILICKPNDTYTDAVFVDTGANVQLNGYTRIVAEVDCLREQFKLYAANEGDPLVCVATIDTLWITGVASGNGGSASNSKVGTVSPKKFDSWMSMAKALDRTEIMIDDCGVNALTEAELANLPDAAAVQAYCRQNRVLLIKDWDTYLGYAK